MPLFHDIISRVAASRNVTTRKYVTHRVIHNSVDKLHYFFSEAWIFPETTMS